MLIKIICKSVLSVVVVVLLWSTFCTGSVSVAETNSNASLCPSWFMIDNKTGQCVCGNDLGGIITCNGNQAFMINCYCMTHDEQMGTMVGGCLTNCILNKKSMNVSFATYYQVPVDPLQLNEALCGNRWNRSGRLCGKCKDGYYPLVYSYDMKCVECTDTSLKYNWLKFIVAAFGPLTVFFVFLLSFGISTTTPPLDAFVLFAQSITIPTNVRLGLELIDSENNDHSFFQILSRLIAMLYGIWNLDFFRTVLPPICLKLSILQTLALDYVIAFYPLTLIAITYALIELHDRKFCLLVWLWKPFKSCSSSFSATFNVKVSIIKVFVSFLLLSYVKLLSVSFDLLVFVKAYNPNGKVIGKYLYFDATTDYFGKEHLPYGIVALIVVIVFILLPLVLILFHPLKCLAGHVGKWPALRISLDSLQGYYKDGTDGGRDYRYFISLSIFARIILFLVFSLMKKSYFYPIAAIIFQLLAVLIIVVKPFKPQFAIYNSIHAVFLLNLAMWCVTAHCIAQGLLKALGQYVQVISAIIAILPLLYITFLALKWIYLRQSVQTYCVQHLGIRLRRKSHVGENENEDARSIDSLPYRIDHQDSAQPLDISIDHFGTSGYGTIQHK